MIDHRRLHVPRENHAILAEPPLGGVTDVVAANLALSGARTYDLQGRPLAEIAQLARRELCQAAYHWTANYGQAAAPPPDPAGPIFLAGHQPEIVHPGVWLKNFALDKLARRHGATAVNLMIDSDALAAASLAVPTGAAASPRIERIAFDHADAAIPYEEREIQDRELFSTFGQRVRAEMGGLVADPLIEQFWPAVLTRARSLDNVGACLSQARHQCEIAWGSQSWEVPQSQVCASESFQWLTAHLLAQLPRFRTVYNEAISRYRHLHHLRSASHPAPELAEDDPWLEAPLWVWTADDPRRRRLFVRQDNRELVLADRQSWEARLPLSADGNAATAVTKLLELRDAGVKIRSRALITTLWARLALGDLFIHGIGGAKYDEVTDLLMERFFGVEPPGFLVLSGTLYLPIERRQTNGQRSGGQAAAARGREQSAGQSLPSQLEGTPMQPQPAGTGLRAIRQELRELTYHPERFLDGAQNAPADALASKQHWIQTSQTRENARQRCQAIRQANEAMQPCLAERRQELLEREAAIIRRVDAQRVLTWREYGFCLYPEAALLQFFASLS